MFAFVRPVAPRQVLIHFTGVMRVILTARSTFTSGYQRYLQRLVNILGAISKNPSNPLFDQYIFESISALIRYVTLGLREELMY